MKIERGTIEWSTAGTVRRCLTTLVGIGAIMSAGLGCSHTSPYYRADLDQTYDAAIPGAGVASTAPEPAWMATSGPAERVVTRLVVIGDAGDPTEDEPVLEALTAWAAVAPDRTLVVFLGDNIYPEGMPEMGDSARAEAEWRLDEQLDAVLASGAPGVFMPGNHDWEADGAPTVERQAAYIAARAGEGVPAHTAGSGAAASDSGASADLQPLPGRGPVSIDLDGVRVILFDTAELLEEDVNGTAVADAAFARLETQLQEAGHRFTVVLGHHPLRTHGPHGGFYDWTDHVFPLRRFVSWLWLPTPVVGSLYPLARAHVFVFDEDLRGSRNRALVTRIEDVLGRTEPGPVFYASGHEHALQVLHDGTLLCLVTGAGSQKKLSSVGHGDDTLFAHLHTGFMVLDLLDDGRLLLRVVEPTEDGGTDVMLRMWLPL